MFSSLGNTENYNYSGTEHKFLGIPQNYMPKYMKPGITRKGIVDQHLGFYQMNHRFVC